VQPVAATEGWVGRIPTVGQMVLGFILPFALAFIAIPLESLIHSGRTVGGVLLLVPVRVLALLLHTLGSLAKHASRVLVHLYDVAIVLPLLAERGIRSLRSAPAAQLDEEDVAAGRRAL
jgi:cobalamin biosynthesis protein CobD/CbiB